MSAPRIEFDGLQDLIEALRSMPARLGAGATTIVTGRAEGAAARIIAAYPIVSGNLAARVTVKATAGGPYGARVVVKNTAKHAYMFENGTEARHYITRNGVKHLTGKSPARRVFIPIVIRERAAMYEDLKAMMIAEGLDVSGDG